MSGDWWGPSGQDNRRDPGAWTFKKKIESCKTEWTREEARERQAQKQKIMMLTHVYTYVPHMYVYITYITIRKWFWRSSESWEIRGIRVTSAHHEWMKGLDSDLESPHRAAGTWKDPGFPVLQNLPFPPPLPWWCRFLPSSFLLQTSWASYPCHLSRAPLFLILRGKLISALHLHGQCPLLDQWRPPDGWMSSAPVSVGSAITSTMVSGV